jgi:hypothetical protein
MTPLAEMITAVVCSIGVFIAVYGLLSLITERKK